LLINNNRKEGYINKFTLFNFSTTHVSPPPHTFVKKT